MSKPDKAPKAQCTGKTATHRPCRGTPLPGSTRCWHHSFKVPGRPGKLTAEIQERILDAVLEGAPMATAAQAVGVSRSTLYRWLERGDHAEAQALEHFDSDDTPGRDELYQHLDPALWPYLDFRDVLKSAEAFAELELLRLTRYGGPQPWTAYMTILERRWAEHWRRRDQVTHEGNIDVGRPVVHAPASEHVRAAIAGILADAGALTNPDQEDPTP